MLNRTNSSMYALLARLMPACNREERPPFVGWVSLAVVGVVLMGAIIGCVAPGVFFPLLATPPPPTPAPNTPTSAPTDTPAPPATPVDTPICTPTMIPSPTPAPPETVECPTDPSQWTMIPYEMRGSDHTLHKIDPPCVMEQVEDTLRECLDARAEAGLNWSREDLNRCYSPSGFTKPLTGETLDGVSGLTLFCSEVVGLEITREIVFYTAGEEGLVVTVLIVTRHDSPSVSRRYDCETDELIEETENDGTMGFVLYWPVLYEDGRWRMGYQPDIYHEVDAETLDPRALADAILMAQGRQTRQP